MVTVIFFPKKQSGATTKQLGSADFYTIPVEKGNDFTCAPADLISFDDAQNISLALDKDADGGQVGEYEWRRA